MGSRLNSQASPLVLKDSPDPLDPPGVEFSSRLINWKLEGTILAWRAPRPRALLRVVLFFLRAGTNFELYDDEEFFYLDDV